MNELSNKEKNKGALLPPIVFTLLLMLSICGCRSIRYVPVETVKTEYISHTDTVLRTDSIIKEKNTIIREADSSLIALLGIQLKNNEKAILVLQKELQKQINKQAEYKTDTIIKVDSIQVPYPVEKQLTKWQQMKMNVGGLAIVLCIIGIVSVVVGFILKRKT